MSKASLISLDNINLNLIVSLYNQVYSDYYFNIYYDKVSLKKYLKSLPVDLKLSQIIKFEDKYVGLAIVSVVNGAAWISSFGVIKKYRKLGLGEKLLMSILSQLKNQGVKSVGLEVLDYNLPAIGLYKKHGFKLISKLTSLEGVIKSIDVNPLKIKEVSTQEALCYLEDDRTYVWSRRKHSIMKKDIKWLGLLNKGKISCIMGYDLDESIIVKRIQLINDDVSTLAFLFEALSKQNKFNRKFYLLNFSDGEKDIIDTAKKYGLTEFLKQNLLFLEF